MNMSEQSSAESRGTGPVGTSSAARTPTLASRTSTAAALAAAASDARAASLPRGPDRVVLLRRL